MIGGRGSVQTLTRRGFAETPLSEGTVAWFTPGTIHRLVNDGDLRIIVVMQNSGLPEAGDAVFTFPAEVLAGDYFAHTQADDEESARRRRDLALEGFLELRRRVEAGEGEALDDFYRAAVRLKQDVLDSWEKRWRAGALASAERTGEHLDRLRDGDIGHLEEADIHVMRAEGPQRFGMCGRLDVHDPAEGRSPHD